MSNHYDVHDLETLAASTRATITRAEVARVLGVDVRTVSRAVDDNQLPSLHIGRRLLVPRVPLLNLLTRDATKAVS